MARLLCFLICSLLGSELIAQKTIGQMIKVGEIKGVDKSRMEQSHGGQLPIFFDKENNLYVYQLGYPETVVSKFSSTFKSPLDLRTGVSLEDSSFSWNNFENTYIFGGNNIVQSFSTGLFWDLGVFPPVTGGTYWGVFKNLILIADSKGRLQGFVLSDPKSIPKAMSHGDTLKYIASRSVELELSIEGDIVLYRDVPWYSYARKIKWGSERGVPYAIDKDRNSYWHDKIFNQVGDQIEILNLADDSGKLIYSQLVFDYEGNLYPIKWTQIYYIGRDWGYPDAKKGTVTLDGAALKLHPGAAELTISTAKSGPVTVFEKTLQKELVSGKSAAWYKVKLASGLVGWIHGGALTVPEDATLKTFDSPVLGKK